MYLKSIEVQGFKSFANKILFEFHNGITGIVGPNGSGKSNVADAVRWVLGEQKVKSLRGASMQDVIFSGTELRKPQGFAYVAITLDNSDHKLAIDFDQVTVARRLYRSGESEYKINGNTCRLKDIHELFYDTGIGKEGYSIIGQGQIDKILSGKPEERRELFDEAAGIVKFKKRKVIAQRKLEDEKQNLVRVSDILSELEKQVSPLQKQSETARKYLQLKDELKRYDVNSFLLETESIRQQLRQLEENQTIVSENLAENTRQVEEIKVEYEKLDEDLEGLDTTITQKRAAVSDGNVRKQSFEGQINVLAEQINTENMNENHIRSRLDSIQGDLNSRQEVITQYQQEYDQISKLLSESSDSKQAAQQQLQQLDHSIQELEQGIESGKANILTILNEKSSFLAKQQRYETMLEQVQVRKAEVSQRLLKSKSDESVQEEYQKVEQQKLDQLNLELKQLTDTQTEQEASVVEYEQRIRQLNKNLNDKQQLYHTSYTKLESLRNLAERYDGYGNSIKRVMEVRDRIHGIHGVVADLITTEKDYEIAVETALGGSIQNIVTDSDQTAKQLIEHLKKNKYGRATFLPLNSISQRGSFQHQDALKEPGVIGLASELVQADSVYDGLIKYLLGRIVVVDNINNAISLARKFRYSLRIVTLEGELLNAGGSMTGGAFKNSSNLLGRRREIEELEQICEKAVSDTEKIQQQLSESEQQFTQLKIQLEEIKAKIQQIRLAQNTLQINISQFEEKKTLIVESMKDLNLENRQIEQQVLELSANQQELKAAMSDLDQQKTATEGLIEEHSKQLDEMKVQREEQANQLSEILLEHANYQQKHQFVTENLNRIQSEIEKLNEEADSLNSGTDQAQDTIKEKQQQIEALKLQIEQLDLLLKLLDEEIKALLQQKEEIAGQQRNFFKKREELSNQVNLLDKELFRLQSQTEKLDEKLENLSNYMWNEYELTLASAEELRQEDLTSPSELKKLIFSLKDQIRQLGHVNVNAIEDYKELSERYDFMKTQYDDLKTAEETLLSIIDELDSGMRRQFEEKFSEIKTEFDKVFRELFGGGHGTLELMDEEDILEAGIQIISQPPGKKLQNMMQLSGGEKALTAIALLFAIQNLKPSPFCLLDEIEAALDDSNVDRFAGYLHKLTKHTQFIIITHRRGTMVASDRLYGITMQEKGVSTLVSVNLIEQELDQ